ncbi:phosphomannomutase [Escherichia coli]|nr:phosphomannomutase [Escherichia coli]
MNTSDVIHNSGIEFGTSGARGLVIDFTHSTTVAFTLAFLIHLKKEFVFKEVALAIDNRPSRFGIAKFCASAIINMGMTPIYYGVIPTPALACKAMAENMPAIMITGSHIPFDRNGMKFYRPDGEITKKDEVEIISTSINFDLSLFKLPHLTCSPAAKNYYIDRYVRLFPKNFLAGKHIGIYEHSSAGRDIYAELLCMLGAKVTSFGRSDEFVPIDTEAVSQNDRDLAKIWSQDYELDAIFSTDGDGDRPLVADETGNWLRGDILGLISAIELGIEALSVPISCNTAIESTGKFTEVYRTRIGSPYVIEAFQDLSKNHKNIAGFEANGGFLLGSDVSFGGHTISALPTRDAVLPLLMLFSATKTSCISSLVRALPERYTFSDRIKNFGRSKSDILLNYIRSNAPLFIHELGMAAKVINIDVTDGLRLILDNSDIIHLRPSGNAPELRCYAESDAVWKAEYLVTSVLKFLSEK